MLELFVKGGPIMWPLLITSIVMLTVIIERGFFLLSLRRSRDLSAVHSMLRLVENGLYNEALRLGESSRDFVARILAAGIAHRGSGMENAVLRSSGRELKRFAFGLTVLDTIVTLAPLLGLLGTVTGMIRAFGVLGAGELEAPTVITGGIAEALIATAYGLGIAITALLPLNYLTTKLEQARSEVEDNARQLELAMTGVPAEKRAVADEAAAKRA